MTPADLRNSVLQLAIQGRLVEQRPEEGTAEELYLEIIAEKTRLIKKGKLKKEKALPEIKEDEIPFEIPESWKWVRLGSCTTYNQTKEKVKGTEISPETWSLDLEDIEKETGRVLERVFAKSRKISGERVVFHKGEILYSKLRPYLKKILVADADGVCSSEMVPFHSYGKMLHEYLAYVLKSPYADFTVNSATYGMKMPRVGTETMLNLLIPLPPLAEQKRIVSRLETLLPYTDRYGEAWSRLEECNERFPVDLQKSLLQSAIQGRLVEQRQEEGTGEELYHEILAEKSRLIKEGKIKKEKALPEIKDDEIPSEIPESWKWVRLGSCTTYNQTKEKVKGTEISPETWSLDLEDIEKETGRVLERVFAKSRKISGERVVFHKGEILYSKLRPYLKKILVADADGVCSSEMVPFHSYGKMLHEYLAYVLKSPYADFTVNSATYGMKMPRVGTETMLNLLIPLPPLAEQKRIVAKLEELLPLCERLTQNNS
jgi:type I restriction enzyme S subunit